MTRFKFGGGGTRASDGLIVTFELADGEIRVERFSQIVRTKGTVTRVRSIEGPLSIEQAAARADELGASIVTISSPSTILRDLQGTRARLEPQRNYKAVGNIVDLPERIALGHIGRLDLLADA